MQMNVLVLIGICLLVFYIVASLCKFRTAKKGITYYNKEIVDILEEQIYKLKKKS